MRAEGIRIYKPFHKTILPSERSEAESKNPVAYVKGDLAGSLDFARDDMPSRVEYDAGAVTND